MTFRESSAQTVILGLALGVIASVLTFSQPIGLGATVFIQLLLCALAFLAWRHSVQPSPLNLTMLIPTLFFAVMLTVRANETLTALNIVMCGTALLLLGHFFHSGNVLRQTAIRYLQVLLEGGITMFVQPFAELVQTQQWLAKQNGLFRRLAPIARGLLVTVPVLIVFLLLFGAADQVFANIVGNVVRSLMPNNVFDFTAHTFYILGFAWLAVGWLAVAVLDRKAKRAPTSAGTNPPASDAPSLEEPARLAPVLRLGFTETMMLLGGVLAVFGLFVVIQFVYLFGGARNIASFSFADYARRGFAELIAVGVLTLVLALVINEVAVRRTRRHQNVFRVTVTLLMTLTSVILVSAFMRLRLYELAYGFTTLRLAVYIAIVWLGVLFAGFTLSLYWLPLRIDVFGTSCLFVVFSFAATLNLLNPDAIVARANIERGDVDPLYLSTLSVDAAPELVRLIDAPEPGLRAIIRTTLARQQAELNNYDRGDWRGANLSKAFALAALKPVSEKLGAEARPVIHLTREALAKTLRQGLTVRETIRQLGFPRTQYLSGRYVDYYSNPEGIVELRYMLDDGQWVALRYDSVTGLQSACFDQQNCLTLKTSQ